MITKFNTAGAGSAGASSSSNNNAIIAVVLIAGAIASYVYIIKPMLDKKKAEKDAN